MEERITGRTVTIGEAVAYILNNIEVLNETAIDSAPDQGVSRIALLVVVSDHLDEEGLANGCCDKGFHCGRACKSTPLSAAKASIFSIRHFGIDPLVFQLDTVEGVRSRAFASLLVPPSAVTMSVAVFMATLLRLA